LTRKGLIFQPAYDNVPPLINAPHHCLSPLEGDRTRKRGIISRVRSIPVYSVRRDYSLLLRAYKFPSPLPEDEIPSPLPLSPSERGKKGEGALSLEREKGRGALSSRGYNP
jgi:hypothetical protein